VRLLEPRGPIRLKVAALGDIGLVGPARARARRQGIDAAFAALAPALGAADLGFANVEMPFGEADWVEPGRTAEFWQDDHVAEGLARAGVQVVSVANNHTMDCGPRGMSRTVEVCRAAGLATVGAGLNLEAARAPARVDVRAQRARGPDAAHQPQPLPAADTRHSHRHAADGARVARNGAEDAAGHQAARRAPRDLDG